MRSARGWSKLSLKSRRPHLWHGPDKTAKEETRRREVAAAKEDADARARILYALGMIRTMLGMSQKQVASLMGTQQSAVSETEKGITDPRLSTLQRQARAIGCRLDVQLVGLFDDDGHVMLMLLEHASPWTHTEVRYNNSNVREKSSAEENSWGLDLPSLPAAS